MSRLKLNKNILSVYLQANVEDLRDGMTWYDNARSFCLELSDKYQVPVDRVIGVVAALSPRNKWSNNKKDAVKLIQAYARYRSDPAYANLNSLNAPSNLNLRLKDNLNALRTHTFNKNRAKAVDILVGSKPEEVLKGQKVRSFYINITKDKDDTEVTVDTHAYSIFLGDRQVGGSIKPKQYVEIQESYKEVAFALGIEPKQLQASTWVTYKRVNKI